MDCQVYARTHDKPGGEMVLCEFAEIADMPEFEDEPVFITPALVIKAGDFIQFSSGYYFVTDGVTGARIGPGGNNAAEAIEALRNEIRSCNLPVSRAVLRISRQRFLEELKGNE